MNSMVRLQGIQTCGLFLLLLSLDSALAQRNGKRFSCSRKIVLSGVSLGSGLRSPISFAPLFSAPECWNGFFCYGIQKYYFCSTRRSTPENKKVLDAGEEWLETVASCPGHDCEYSRSRLSFSTAIQLFCHYSLFMLVCRLLSPISECDALPSGGCKLK
jgi:hypothetical protein